MLHIGIVEDEKTCQDQGREADWIQEISGSLKVRDTISSYIHRRENTDSGRR